MIPADVVFLKSSDYKNESCFLEQQDTSGENDLKEKKCV